MIIESFDLSRLPRISFGGGRIAEVPDLVRTFGKRALLITGKHSFLDSPYRRTLLDELRRRDIDWLQESVSGEPSPQSPSAAHSGAAQ